MEQTIKRQLGELLFSNCALMTQLEQAQARIQELERELAAEGAKGAEAAAIA